MTTVSQLLGNRLLKVLHNHQCPLLVNGRMDTYSRSNETNPIVGKCVLCSVEEELSEEQDS
jgi:hypothetical protein